MSGTHALLGKSVAGSQVPAAECLLKPVHALLRGAVGERIGIHVSGCHALQTTVSDHPPRSNLPELLPLQALKFSLLSPM
jgi:hypothetical protein